MAAELDADARVTLEEERDFLLASLRDLERERDAGDVDEHDYATLRADYTARAAAALRALDPGEAEPTATPAPPRRRGRRALVVGGVAVVAVVAGLLVTQASGRRDVTATGEDVRAASGRLPSCQALDQEGDAEAALDCYTEILDEVPANVEALTFRGWLQVREGDIEAGLADLDQAVDLAPEATSPFVFRGIAHVRSDDPVAAISDFAAFYANEPTDEERALADPFAAEVVDTALDACVAGEVDGTLDAVAAVRCYRDVLVVDEGNAAADVYLGWLLARAGQDDLALEHLDAGLAADPELSAGYVFRAALHAHLGDLDAARADLATFEATDDPPAEQVAAAAQVAAAIAQGQDPLAG